VPTGTRWAAWSPTGAAIAYIVQSTSGAPDQSGLYVAATPDQPGRRVQSGEFLPASPGAPDRLLNWSSADTILLTLPDGRFVLVRLT
jgi:hypothetical protein